MWEALLNHFFACNHQRTTFPLTCTRQAGSGPTPPRATYVTCLECGAELAYDWGRMRVGAPIRDTQRQRTQWMEWRIERDEIG